MGLFLVAVLFSLAIGPHREGPGWHCTFGWSALIVLAVVILDWLAARSFGGTRDPEDYDGSAEDVERLGT
jgi:hypothetical protein